VQLLVVLGIVRAHNTRMSPHEEMCVICTSAAGRVIYFLYVHIL
jgi:hypothetical protein